jgi:predicted nucleic acid-binding protein
MMMIEAASLPGWSTSNIKRRLQRQPQVVGGLTLFENALRAILSSKVSILLPAPGDVASAAAISRQAGLLSNDALIVSVMQHHGLVNLASADGDFDRVPWISRFAPV